MPAYLVIGRGPQFPDGVEWIVSTAAQAELQAESARTLCGDAQVYKDELLLNAAELAALAEQELKAARQIPQGQSG